MPKRFVEIVTDSVTLLEAVEDRPGRFIRAVGAVADQVNLNGRVYPAAVLREAVERVQGRSLNGRWEGSLGEADHPPTPRPRIRETAVKWESVVFDEETKRVLLDGRLIETSAGKDIIAIMEAGVLPGVSLRGKGTSELIADGPQEIERVTYLELTGFDLVFEQAFPEAGVTMFEQADEEELAHSQLDDEAIVKAMARGVRQLLVSGDEQPAAETAEPVEAQTEAPASDEPESTSGEGEREAKTVSGEADVTVEGKGSHSSREETSGAAGEEVVTKATGEQEMEQEEVVQEEEVQEGMPPAEGGKRNNGAGAKIAAELAEQFKAREAAEKALAEQKRLQEEAEKARKEAAELAAQRERELQEAQAELARIERERVVAAAIQEHTSNLPYQGNIKAAFIKAVQADAGKLQSAEAVKALVEAKRSEYDAIVAEARIAGMGFGRSGVTVMGPVFERETGQPAFAEAAYMFTEQLAVRGQAQIRDFGKAVAPAELLAKRYLEAFDKYYKTQLANETAAFKHWQEAELTTDLNLPYSVARAIVSEAIPELVAANIFDFGLIDRSPERVYYEHYTNESGTAPTISDEAVTSDVNAWVSLAHKRVIPGTVTVEADGGGTEYEEFVDYVIDYAEGRIWTIAAVDGGSIGDETALDVTYTYRKIREGEMAAIQRGKGTLDFKDISVAADRLSVLISGEALTFSQSQLNWDAVSRSVAMLIREIREDIDVGIFRRAVAAAVISKNSGGVWTAATDTLDALVEKMGAAKVAVEMDHYTPTAFIASKTNADRLSNWAGLTRQGFPDAMLGAAGFAQMSIKGLPVFSSTAMPDNIILVADRELVQHRVLSTRPMRLDGPHQARSSDNLVSAQEWFVEEYNWTDALINEKGGYVRVA